MLELYIPSFPTNGNGSWTVIFDVAIIASYLHSYYDKRFVVNFIDYVDACVAIKKN